jgi:hypothetical protein
LVADVWALIQTGGFDWMVTDGEVALAVQKLKRLNPPELGAGLRALWRAGALSVLLEEMPAPVQADFIDSVRHSGNAKARATVAHEAANEAQRLSKGPLSRFRTSSIEMWQAAIRQMIQDDPAAVLSEILAGGDLKLVVRSLLQPFSEENGKALRSLLLSLVTRPTQAALFLDNLRSAMLHIGLNAGYCREIKDGYHEQRLGWDEDPLLEALHSRGDVALVRFFRQMWRTYYDQPDSAFGWSEQEVREFRDVFQHRDRPFNDTLTPMSKRGCEGRP